ncbi:MAG: fibronectin type III domain-containing protein [Acidobacteriota bacterium]|nr:fibronectin type III domain-containing protein [Acidobacteriota bacterium]
MPPTLNLPQTVSGSGLTATRAGAAVKLHWTTPSLTTDKMAVKGTIMAEICRETVAGLVRANGPCSPVGRVQVTPGASDAVDALPADLLAGPPRVLAYRVQLINAAGRTAGPSVAVLAVSGPTVAPVEGFAGEAVKAGVELHWRREKGAGSVELDRVLLNAAPKSAKAPAESIMAALSGAGKQAVETRLRADSDAGDAGGMLDRTVEIGRDYSFTAERMVRVQVGGQTLEARSEPSAALQFEVRDRFPPDVPAGLVAVPGMGEGSPITIDLSWDPDIEPRLAGYRVYRREDGSAEWQRIGPELVTEAAYRDEKVTAGRRYVYRVTAVSTAGNESGPSVEAAESAPGAK